MLAKIVSEVDASRTLCREQDFGRNIDVLANDFEKRFVKCRQGMSFFQFTIDPFSFQPDRLPWQILFQSTMLQKRN